LSGRVWVSWRRWVCAESSWWCCLPAFWPAAVLIGLRCRGPGIGLSAGFHNGSRHRLPSDGLRTLDHGGVGSGDLGIGVTESHCPAAALIHKVCTRLAIRGRAHHNKDRSARPRRREAAGTAVRRSGVGKDCALRRISSPAGPESPQRGRTHRTGHVGDLVALRQYRTHSDDVGDIHRPRFGRTTRRRRARRRSAGTQADRCRHTHRTPSHAALIPRPQETVF